MSFREWNLGYIGKNLFDKTSATRKLERNI